MPFRGGCLSEQSDGVNQRIVVSRIRFTAADGGRPAGRVADDQLQRVRIRQRRRAPFGEPLRCGHGVPPHRA